MAPGMIRETDGATDGGEPMLPGMIWERVCRETRHRPNYQ